MPSLLAALLALSAFGDGVREAPPPPSQKVPQLTKAPALVEFHPAEYPAEALAAGVQADVSCLVDIGADGRVTRVQVQASAGPEFDAAAVQAIRSFVFSPAEFDQVPAPVRIGYVYHFVFDKKPVAPGPAAPPDPELCRIEGLVREAGNRKPVAGADITLDALTATTDAKGRFALANVPPGRRRVRASAAGFAEASQRVTLVAKSTLQVTLTLRRTVLGELEATVIGEKPKEAPTRRSLSQAELKNVPGSLNDPIRAVQNLPGLARAPFLSGALLVRGSPPADTGIFLDGDKIPLLFHFLGGPSVINEQMLDRIDFYPGGMGSYYGRNLTGAIDVATRPGDGGAFHGQVSVDLLQSALFVEAPLSDHTRVAVAARRSYIDFFLPLFLPNDPKTGITTVTPVYWDYQARLDHELDNGDSLFVLAFGSDDSLALVQKGTKQPQDISLDSHIAFHRVHGAYKHALGPDATVTLSPAIGWALTSFSTGGTGSGPAGTGMGGSLTDLGLGLRADLRWQLLPTLQLRSGLDLQHDRYTVSADIVVVAPIVTVGARVTEPVHLERLQPFTQWGEYVEAELKLGPVQLVPGLRLDQIHWLTNTEVSVDPRLWLRWTLGEKDQLKGSIGQYHQPPTAFQADAQLGNAQLGLERATQFGLGWERHFSDVWSASLDLFYNRKNFLVQTALAQALPDGTIWNPRLLNTGIGRATGAELLIRREFTSTLYGWLAYTISKAEILRRSGEQWRVFQFDQPHILTLVVGYRPSLGWELSTRYRFTSGNPSSPVVNSVFDDDTGSYIPERGNFGDAREPFFSQLDARAQYTWTWDLFKLTFYLDVQNVTNRTNQEFHVYDYRFRQDGSISSLPILPTLGLSGRW